MQEWISKKEEFPCVVPLTESQLTQEYLHNTDVAYWHTLKGVARPSWEIFFCEQNGNDILPAIYHMLWSGFHCSSPVRVHDKCMWLLSNKLAKTPLTLQNNIQMPASFEFGLWKPWDPHNKMVVYAFLLSLLLFCSILSMLPSPSHSAHPPKD